MTSGRGWVPRAICAAGLVWCAVVVAFHWLAGSLACALDTSYCAFSHEKDGVYAGILRDADGHKLPNREFSVAFESRRDMGRVGGFSTDRDARYCIVWANERITPFASAGGGPSIAIRDSWRRTRDSARPAGCQSGDEGIPWNRADDRLDRPQFRVPVALGAAGMVLLAVGLVGGAKRRVARRSGLALAAVTTASVAAVWLL
jgi:hypothetical protein